MRRISRDERRQLNPSSNPSFVLTIESRKKGGSIKFENILRVYI